MQELLKEVLKNQKIMMERLSNIETRLERIQENQDKLELKINVVEQSNKKIENNVSNFQRSLDKLNVDLDNLVNDGNIQQMQVEASNPNSGSNQNQNRNSNQNQTFPNTELIINNLNQNDSQSLVYITQTGKKYHSRNCEYAKKSIAITLHEALDKKLDKCKVCFQNNGR